MKDTPATRSQFFVIQLAFISSFNIKLSFRVVLSEDTSLLLLHLARWQTCKLQTTVLRNAGPSRYLENRTAFDSVPP